MNSKSAVKLFAMAAMAVFSHKSMAQQTGSPSYLADNSHPKKSILNEFSTDKDNLSIDETGSKGNTYRMKLLNLKPVDGTEVMADTTGIGEIEDTLRMPMKSLHEYHQKNGDIIRVAEFSSVDTLVDDNNNYVETEQQTIRAVFVNRASEDKKHLDMNHFSIGQKIMTSANEGEVRLIYAANNQYSSDRSVDQWRAGVGSAALMDATGNYLSLTMTTNKFFNVSIPELAFKLSAVKAVESNQYANGSELGMRNLDFGKFNRVQ